MPHLVEGTGAQMSEDDRRRFESLAALMAAAYSSFNDRRSHEWKLSLSIWTALAVFLGAIVQPIEAGKMFPMRGSGVWLLGLFLSGGIVVLHAVWSDWASRANQKDKVIQLHFRDEMATLAQHPLPPAIRHKLDENRTVGWTQPSHLVQTAITALLSLAIVIALYGRSL
jgi:hypothetical protein